MDLPASHRFEEHILLGQAKLAQCAGQGEVDGPGMHDEATAQPVRSGFFDKMRAIHARQTQIDNTQIRRQLAQVFQGFLARSGTVQRELVEFAKILEQQLANPLFVINNKNLLEILRHGGPPESRRGVRYKTSCRFQGSSQPTSCPGVPWR